MCVPGTDEGADGQADTPDGDDESHGRCEGQS
jgi:hypothetical protein